MIENKLKDIIPITTPELDCYQNLVASIIQDRGYCVEFLGAVWPWEFTRDSKRDKELFILVDTEPVNINSLKKIYNIRMEITFPKDIETAWVDIKNKLDEGIPVITNFDQFHAHYHYPHIYGKRHGEHAVMLLSYDDQTKLIACVSSIPFYKGTMHYNQLFMGMQEVSELSYTILVFGDAGLVKSKYNMWSEFHILIENLKLTYFGSMHQDSENEMIYAPGLKRLLEDLLLQENQQLSENLQTLCSGTWGWHIDRRCKWTINFILLFKNKLNEGTISRIVNLLEENNRDWVLVYRFLFKASQTLKKSELYNTVERLQHIIEREVNIFDEILTATDIIKMTEVKQ
ncbi:BtrH N-terminal domain-containing protein [Paenibacillus humicus]|uniref:BtrH N-terminal domain-containing protein n=1 Tax=Paenibacillus humicus TaxID=412861 RepID=UPI003D296400